jgi:hypothetical protein
MPLPKSAWKRRLIGGALGLIALNWAWNPLSRSGAYLAAWLFPQEIELFVADRRASGDFSRDLERVYPSLTQRRDGVRVAVRRVAREDVVRSAAQLFDKFEQTRNAGGSSKLFIELAEPYSCSKRALRAAIDEQSRFIKEARVALLQRVVAIVGARAGSACGGEPDAPRVEVGACDRLKDDWQYTQWSFGSIGLAVDERTIDLVGQCLPRLIMIGKKSDG